VRDRSDVLDETLAGYASQVTDAGDAYVAPRKHLGIVFWLAVAWLVVVIAAAVLAPVLPIADPEEFADSPGLGLFSGDNILGTDEGGRDLLARVIWGSRVSLLVGAASIAFGLVVGGALGILAGYKRGWMERITMGVFDVALAFPALVLALLFLTFLGRELQWVLLVIGILAVAPIGRLARANTLVWAQREFVTASRGLGAKGSRVMWREILPNVSVSMTALALLACALAIVAEGSLAFLGLSVEGDITWGNMIVAGASGNTLRIAPLSAFVPITAMFLTVLALNFIGDRLRQHLQVREAFGAA
jgi:peptide/nickel transport system permease protein